MSSGPTRNSLERIYKNFYVYEISLYPYIKKLPVKQLVNQLVNQLVSQLSIHILANSYIHIEWPYLHLS